MQIGLESGAGADRLMIMITADIIMMITGDLCKKQDSDVRMALNAAQVSGCHH